MLFLLGDCCFWLDNPCVRRACPPWVRTCGACRLSWWVCWPWASEWWSSTVTSPASPPPGASSASLGRKWEHLSLGFGLHGGVSPWPVMSKSGPPHSLAARCLLPRHLLVLLLPLSLFLSRHLLSFLRFFSLWIHNASRPYFVDHFNQVMSSNVFDMCRCCCTSSFNLLKMIIKIFRHCSFLSWQ